MKAKEISHRRSFILSVNIIRIGDNKMIKSNGLTNEELLNIWSRCDEKKETSYLSKESIKFMSGFTGCDPEDKEGIAEVLTDVILTGGLSRFLDSPEDREAVKHLIIKRYN